MITTLLCLDRYVAVQNIYFISCNWLYSVLHTLFDEFHDTKHNAVVCQRKCRARQRLGTLNKIPYVASTIKQRVFTVYVQRYISIQLGSLDCIQQFTRAIRGTFTGIGNHRFEQCLKFTVWTTIIKLRTTKGIAYENITFPRRKAVK